jgi:hypothetical protein
MRLSLKPFLPPAATNEVLDVRFLLTDIPLKALPCEELFIEVEDARLFDFSPHVTQVCIVPGGLCVCVESALHGIGRRNEVACLEVNEVHIAVGEASKCIGGAAVAAQMTAPRKIVALRKISCDIGLRHVGWRAQAFAELDAFTPISLPSHSHPSVVLMKFSRALRFSLCSMSAGMS